MVEKILDRHDIAVVVRGNTFVWGRVTELDDSQVNIVQSGLTIKEAYQICSDNNYRPPLSQRYKLGRD